MEVDRAAVQQLLGASVHPVEGGGELRGGDRAAIDADALGRLDQMRRGEQAGAQAGGAQPGFDHGAGGAFAVGAGDVHDARQAFGIAERLEQRGDALQAELGGLDFVAERVEELDRIGVVHYFTGPQKKVSALEM